MKFNAEVTHTTVLDNGVNEIRFEVKGDKEKGISGHGVLRTKSDLKVEPEQKLYIDAKAGPKVKRGKGNKGVLDLSKALITSDKGDK